MTLSPHIEKLLAEVSSKPRQRGNLIFGLDATASRERTWDTASQLQASMFLEVVGIGGLDLQLIYFRGMRGVNAECKASPWISDPVVLARMMAKIRCETGYTQIDRVLLTLHVKLTAQDRRRGLCRRCLRGTSGTF